MIKYIIVLFIIPFVVFSHEKEEVNIWQPLEFLIGSWIGDETGKAGIGKGERTYQYIMNKKYISIKNTNN